MDHVASLHLLQSGNLEVDWRGVLNKHIVHDAAMRQLEMRLDSVAQNWCDPRLIALLDQFIAADLGATE